MRRVVLASSVALASSGCSDNAPQICWIYGDRQHCDIRGVGDTWGAHTLMVAIGCPSVLQNDGGHGCGSCERARLTPLLSGLPETTCVVARPMLFSHLAPHARAQLDHQPPHVGGVGGELRRHPQRPREHVGVGGGVALLGRRVRAKGVARHLGELAPVADDRDVETVAIYTRDELFGLALYCCS